MAHRMDVRKRVSKAIADLALPRIGAWARATFNSRKHEAWSSLGVMANHVILACAIDAAAWRSLSEVFGRPPTKTELDKVLSGVGPPPTNYHRKKNCWSLP